MSNPFNFGTPVPPHRMVGRWHQVETVAHDLANLGDSRIRLLPVVDLARAAFWKRSITLCSGKLIKVNLEIGISSQFLLIYSA